MTTIKLTGSVKINGAHFLEHIVRMLWAARETAPKLSDNSVWVTSANDATHKQGSRHYTNEAFDIRVRNIAGDVAKEGAAWAARIKKKLGANYDIIFEGDHIHLEYDPKK